MDNAFKPLEKRLLKLDFGCGPNPADGFDGVDSIQFNDRIKHILDLKVTPYPFEDESVEFCRAYHFVEHLTKEQRIQFMNEIHRILIPGGKFEMAVPHWSSNRAYGDPTHEWPPISEMWFYYLSKEWRKTQAPHTDIEFNPLGYSCDFEATWGYTLRADVVLKNQETQVFMMSNYKEVCMDTIATMVKK